MTTKTTTQKKATRDELVTFFYYHKYLEIRFIGNVIMTSCSRPLHKLRNLKTLLDQGFQVTGAQFSTYEICIEGYRFDVAALDDLDLLLHAMREIEINPSLNDGFPLTREVTLWSCNMDLEEAKVVTLPYNEMVSHVNRLRAQGGWKFVKDETLFGGHWNSPDRQWSYYVK